MLYSLIRLASLAFIVLIAGCTTETITEPLPTGTMVGRAFLHKLKEPVYDHSGIRVTIEGTAFSTMTDKNGDWRIDDLPTRTYTVVYEHEGFGLMKQPMVSFIGGGVVRVQSVSMSAIPKCGTVFDAVRQIDTFYIEAHAHATCSELDSMIGFINEYIVFVFSNSPDVSADPSKHKFAQLTSTPQPRGTATAMLSKQQIEQYLDINDSIYIAAYNVGGTGWIDPLTDRTIYTSWHPDRDRTLAIKWNQD
ncbi:MAG TPA: carboxypeptidase-like regulatory domain-containing protein [Candidatus Kapabacteria bacterium]|nr:carboxypeptidase-like regulatory domain-containing protein [Candidatus Kapabacteria bacterium]